jgi:hypothetical protein
MSRQDVAPNRQSCGSWCRTELSRAVGVPDDSPAQLSAARASAESMLPIMTVDAVFTVFHLRRYESPPAVPESDLIERGLFRLHT